MTALNAEATVASLLSTLQPAAPLQPRGARRISTATPEDHEPAPGAPNQEKENVMPRGVYDRKKKDDAGGGDSKPRRKYTKRTQPAMDVPAIALESVLLAASRLEQVVRDNVDINGDTDLTFALDNFATQKKLYDAVKG